jgi:methyl-accepting chemotaxis protein
MSRFLPTGIVARRGHRQRADRAGQPGPVGRTEEQASALEQTAASMEQLGSTVKPERRQRPPGQPAGAGASDGGRAGGEVVGQVVETMKGINDSSARSPTSSA